MWSQTITDVQYNCVPNISASIDKDVLYNIAWNIKRNIYHYRMQLLKEQAHNEYNIQDWCVSNCFINDKESFAEIVKNTWDNLPDTSPIKSYNNDILNFVKNLIFLLKYTTDKNIIISTDMINFLGDDL